jgi:hypothetical protein
MIMQENYKISSIQLEKKVEDHVATSSCLKVQDRVVSKTIQDQVATLK